ncbi:hypothetical protein [Sorangium sp. So ce362]|uniref:hypothetical protein n=1 Tax=Sorangium sp. So ce362 TaxID=3133303 RepID=UPI003F62541E
MGLDDKLRKDRASSVDAGTWARRLDQEFAKIAAGIELKPGTYGPAPIPDRDIGDGQVRISGRDNAVMASNNAVARYRISVGGKPVNVDLALMQKEDGGYHIEFAETLRIMCPDDSSFYSNIEDALIAMSKR